MIKSQKFTLGLVIVFLLLVGVVYTVKNASLTDESNNKQQLVDLGFFKFSQGRTLAPVVLEDLDGNETTLANRHEQWQLVNFGYMFCPDICPVNLQLMSEIKTAWDASDKEAFEITHITFDPVRDTPERLSKYLEYIDPDYKGFTGKLENIRTVAQQLSTVFIHEKPDEYGNYFITHSDSIALLNPKGEYVGLFKGPYDKDNVLKALALLIN